MIMQALLVGLAAGPTPAATSPNSSIRAVTRSAYEADVARAFERLDVDRDKHLSKSELAPMIAQAASTMKARGEAARHREFARLDSNKDGNVSLSEYLAPVDVPAIEAPLFANPIPARTD